ncbi:MNIO family bufferin maturase [Leeia aquatica]|uniref:UPF0276 protein HF682_10390 n=1 Tax=Leeia aquatica TaxID=2725557 RepID=A0A847SEF4_9NEIS|nr:DUF692 domain-containing protein [Leeia aquatica]NLR75568.1 DUF692 domain-containing protein [Leeia aquatica]
MTSPLLHAPLGFGLGLRPPHYAAILDEQSPLGAEIDWFEIISENYMIPGGRPLYFLDRIRERWPVVMHGVSLSIGSTDPLDLDYLRDLKALAHRAKPAWISDHLCWTGAHGAQVHDLLPLPFTEEAVRHVASRVRQVQDVLGQRILLENVSSYLQFEEDEMREWEFISAIAEAADCLLLLDVNNVYVSSVNHGFDPEAYLAGIPARRVQQFHVAGHETSPDLLIDTHDHAVPDPVWQLYRSAVQRFGPASTLLERDDDLPDLDILVQELQLARDHQASSLKAAA